MESATIAKNSIIPKRIWKKIIISFVFLVVFEFVGFPLPVLASQAVCDTDNNPDAVNEPVAIDIPTTNSDSMGATNSLPLNIDLGIARTDYRIITAYSSEVSQCDGDPCHTAMGFNLCTYGIEDTIAANFLPFGAKVRLPELFGNRIFIVRDRMNSRFNDRIDVWLKNSEQARHFGLKVSKVEILEEP